MKNHKERFEFDTVESAADWRREIAGGASWNLDACLRARRAEHRSIHSHVSLTAGQANEE